jgi:hypothetical protein
MIASLHRKENSMRRKEFIEADIAACDKALTEQHSLRGLLMKELIGCNEKEVVTVYDLWRGACISRSDDPSVDELLRFDHRDGTVATCYDIHGDLVNLGVLEKVYVWSFNSGDSYVLGM